MSLVTGDNALRFATSIDNSGLQSGAQDAQGIIARLANSISDADIFAGLTVGAGIAFKNIAEASYEMSKEFEQSMKEVATVSDSVAMNFDGMSEAVMKLSTEVPDSALDLSKALYQISSAGYDGADGLKVLEVSSKSAIAGVTDVRTAADGLTTILNAWKIKASETASVTDQLFATVKGGKTTFPELSRSISDVASIAASAGIPLNQILAAIATMTKQGVPTAQAFTQIRQAIIGTNKVLGDGWSKSMSFQQAMQAVSDKAGGSQTQLTTMVGSVEALNAVLALSGKNATMAASDLDNVTNSAGSADKAFQTMMGSATNQSKILRNNIQAALKPLGDWILHNVTDLAKFLNDAFKSGEVEKFAKMIGIAVSALVAYKTASKLASLSIADIKQALDVASQALNKFTAAAKANPWGLLAAAAVAAIAAYEMFGQKVSITNDIMVKASELMINDTRTLDAFKTKLFDVNTTQEDRGKIIAQINSQYGQYLPNLLTEKASYDDLSIALGTINTQLRLKYELQASEEKAVELQKKKIELEDELSKKKAVTSNQTAQEIIDFGEKIKKYATFTFILGSSKTNTDIKGEINDVNESYKAVEDRIKKINEGVKTYDHTQKESSENTKKSTGVSIALLKEQLKVLQDSREKATSDAERKELKLKIDSLQKLIDKLEGVKHASKKEPVTYLDQLNLALEDAKQGLESLSGKNVDPGALKSQQEIISNLEQQIDYQQRILGIKKEETKETKDENYALAGSLAFEEKKLQELEAQRKLATSPEERQRIEGEIESQQKYIEKLEGVKATKKEISQMDFAEALAVNKAANKEMQGLDEASKKYKEFATIKLATEKRIGELAGDWLGGFASMLDSMANSLGGLNSKLGDTLSNIAKIAGDTGNLIKGLATGNYLQAAASAVSLVADVFTIKKRKREKEEKEHQENLNKLIAQQNKEIEDQLKLLAEAKGMDVLSGYQAAIDDVNRSLAEIERLQKKDKSQSLIDQETALIDKKKQLITDLYSTVTGTTSNSITDSIVQGFENGQTAASDFAGTFENLMKTAIMNSFKLKFLDKQFDEFYKEFGAAAESGGGLSKSEIEALKVKFNANIETARKGFDEFNGLFQSVFGESMSKSGDGITSTKQGMAGEIKATLTEETGSVLAGTINSIRLYVASNNAIMIEMNNHLARIEDNTNYNKELRRLERIESLLADQSQTLRSIGA